jgi:hypothetical protein
MSASFGMLSLTSTFHGLMGVSPPWEVGVWLVSNMVAFLVLVTVSYSLDMKCPFTGSGAGSLATSRWASGDGLKSVDSEVRVNQWVNFLIE